LLPSVPAEENNNNNKNGKKRKERHAKEMINSYVNN